MSLSFGDTRPGLGAWVAIGSATAVLVVIAGGLAWDGGAGWWQPLMVLVPIHALVVLWILCRRRVEVCADRPEVVITRTLYGLAWRRRIPFPAFGRVVSRGVWMRPRGGSPLAGTPEGDAVFIKFDLSLRRGWRGLHVEMMNDVALAEALALLLARRIGVPASRRDYARRVDGLAVWRRGAREDLG
ncbi:hypothetical protein [Roseomonas sp. CECT 9278]|uniref:hypothetical protein n=1 Tax=Roseomonas sp. CECT 9278 TaxID=2845823 RepID=UPI001E2AF78A|nr:hypothetical protein [Roseomonas sp. CECT 9278]CAH0167919.1 hypothetical protein ROS9278_01121 [Roseomonas sp. CECT 9278]